MKNKIITFIFLLISLLIVWYNQITFHKMTAWNNNHIDINILNKDTLLINKLLTFWNSWIWATFFEHKLPLDILSSIDTWENKWLEKNENQQYIQSFFKLYGARSNIYLDVFNNIINSPTINDKNKLFYSKMINSNIEKEKSDNNLNPRYKKVVDTIYPILCNKWIKYPFNKNFEIFYRTAGIEKYKNKNYSEAWCYLLMSWYSAKLNLWKGFTLIALEKKWEKELSHKDFINNYKKNQKLLFNLSIYLKNIAINEKVKDIHRNTNKRNNIILINSSYVTASNSLTNSYLKFKAQ